MRYSIVVSVLLIMLAALSWGCAEEGESGTVTVDCGQHGAEHDGHCHCDPGYLYAEETCLPPSEVTAVCEEHEDEEGDVTSVTDVHEEEHHHHDACRCPDGAECHCESGTIEAYGTVSYCVPELHVDE